MPISVKGQLFTSAAMAGNLESNVWEIKNLPYVSVQYIITGTPNGTLDIQYSSDSTYPGSDGYFHSNHVVASAGATPIANWITVDSKTITSGAPASWFYDATTGAKWLRVLWTNTSGTGTLNLWVSGKSGGL